MYSFDRLEHVTCTFAQTIIYPRNLTAVLETPCHSMHIWQAQVSMSVCLSEVIDYFF